MKKVKDLIKPMIKTRRFIYLTIILIIVLLGVTFNIAFGAFSSNNVNEFINTKVANITYSLNINGYSGLIYEINANKEKSIELNIQSLETYDTKYEVIYELCTDSKCNEFHANLDGLEVLYSSLSTDEISGIIEANANKSIRLVIKNNTENTQYIKLGINSGYVHNTLELKDLIVKEYLDDFLTANILTQYNGLANIEEAPLDTFNNINTLEENNLYKTVDNHGYSYYFRGTKNYLNNNLIFAGMKWKIVRINGDETIRLIYEGKCLDDICLTLNEEIINSAFNKNNDDNKYLGYMYGPLSDTRENAVKNELNSTIKVALDTWYENNFLENDYEPFIVNTMFCNDRRLLSEISEEETGLGFGTENTIYAANYRLVTNKNPNLKCPSVNDQFLLSDENLLIKYPIGLLNADEASFAGLVYNLDNSTNYLKTDYPWWTLSPDSFSDKASTFYVSATGSLVNNDVSNIAGLRPVINIKDDVKVRGTGSINDPYIIIK